MMTDDIFIIHDNGTLVEMHQQDYDSEALLQGLLADYPKLLAGGQIDTVSPRKWLLIKREMGIPGEEAGGERWSVDHLFVDQDAIPTLVEVKRSSDTRIRREVVGQMLDYAANAVVYWPVEQLRGEFEKNCDDAEETLAAFLGEDVDPDEFWQRVKTNLQAGKIRMLFVADVIPNELRRIVEFLNEQMDPAEVLAVEIKQYVGEGMKSLVPRVFGQTAEAERKKRSPGRSPATDEVRRGFWEAFQEMMKQQAPHLALGASTDGSKVEFVSQNPDLQISSRADRKVGKLSVVLRIRGVNAQRKWEQLKRYLEKKDISVTENWICGTGKKGIGFLVSTSRPLTIDATDTWAQQHQWVLSVVRDVYDVLLPVIEEEV